MASPKLTGLELTNFTAFRDLDLTLSPGVNVFIGENATGKTHLLKVLYAACDVLSPLPTATAIPGDEEPPLSSFQDSLRQIMAPSGGDTERLRHQGSPSGAMAVAVHRGEHALRWRGPDQRAEGEEGWMETAVECAFIPAKEMLAHAPGFIALYARREISFDKTYVDIVQNAYLSPLRGEHRKSTESLCSAIERAIGGTVLTEGDEFFLDSDRGKLEFTLVAQGLRKLALIALLIRNGTLAPGSILFRDEPEANLNPRLMGRLIDVLLELRRLDVQVFLATHSYVVLKELDLQSREDDGVVYHALYRGAEDDGVHAASTSDYLSIHPNAIGDTFGDLYDRDIQRALGQEAG